MVISEHKVVKKAERILSDIPWFLIILIMSLYTKSFGNSYKPIQIVLQFQTIIINANVLIYPFDSLIAYRCLHKVDFERLIVDPWNEWW